MPTGMGGCVQSDTKISAVISSPDSAEIELVGKIVLPFMRVLVNIQKHQWSRTALAPLSKAYRADIAAGGARAQIARPRPALGTMPSMAAMAMV